LEHSQDEAVYPLRRPVPATGTRWTAVVAMWRLPALETAPSGHLLLGYRRIPVKESAPSRHILPPKPRRKSVDNARHQTNYEQPRHIGHAEASEEHILRRSCHMP